MTAGFYLLTVLKLIRKQMILQINRILEVTLLQFHF